MPIMKISFSKTNPNEKSIDEKGLMTDNAHTEVTIHYTYEYNEIMYLHYIVIFN